MKKTYKLMAILFAFLTFSSFLMAQTWDEPSYEGEIPVSGTAYYIYNVGSNGFLNRGGWWATQACVTTHVKQNASSNVNKWTSVNTSGSTWTFQYNNNGANIANNYLFDTGGGTDVYTDNSTNNTFTVTETDAVNHIYTIQSPLAGSNYLGCESATETTNRGIANIVRPNRETVNDFVKWKFISQANYDLFQAKVVLDRYMTYAKLKGDIDITSYIATYNSDVTADITTASANLLTALAPINTTSLISNASFETGFTGWTNSGFATQTNTPPFTKDGTTYAERYVGGPSNLGTSTLTQSVSLPNGVYQLVISGHAFQQSGSNPLHTNAYVTAGSKTTEISAAGDYVIDNIEVTGGSLIIGYKLEGAIACNWTGFDNFKLYRYITYSTPGLSASATSLRYDDIFASSSITIGGSNLISDIAITVPSGITLSGANIINNGVDSYTILAANANSSNGVTVTYDGSSNVNGTIALSATGSGGVPANFSVIVKATTNAECFTPAYSDRPNMIADPTFSLSISGFASGGYAGWGPKAIDTKNPYCGAATCYIFGSCYPNGGSLDRPLNTANGNALKPNSTYRLRAMVNSQAITGSFQFEIEGTNGAGTSTYFQIENTGGWVQFDKLFTTGASVTEAGIYFNSCTTPPAITDTCFIDNYELYDVTDIVSGNVNHNIDNLYATSNNGNVEIHNINKGETVRIFTVTGQLVKSFNSANNQINVQLKSGIYLIKANNKVIKVMVN